ncbi:tyrosine-type recombinase/integrase [Salipaludibacillus sp. CF4.18]|uniref:tyrosine-type recombinase/integrase n=1 Tax=Salipaludibacillus sp. CF4.18 TaxID=3373081 RepID=UPI003EE56191
MLFRDHIQLFIVDLRALGRSKSTISGYSQDLLFYEKWLAQNYNCQVFTEDIVMEDLEKFFLMLREERHYKPSSMKRMHIALKMFFKLAWKKKWCTEDIASEIRPVRIPQAERDYLTEEEVMEFVTAIDHKLVRVVVISLFYSGLRIAEALALNMDDVDMESRKLFVRNGKGNKSRTVPMSEKLYVILNDYLEWKVKSDDFFATEKTGRLSKVRVQAVVRETREKLGWRRQITPHVFRHSFASRLVHNHVDIVAISKLLGHSDLKTTSIYTHSSMAQLEDAVSVL